jgi:hypothetical protein
MKSMDANAEQFGCRIESDDRDIAGIGAEVPKALGPDRHVLFLFGVRGHPNRAFLGFTLVSLP